MSEQTEETEINSLIQTIDVGEDELHADFTPSVLKLIEKGLPGARAVLGLLDAPEFLTRKRVQRVLEGIVMRRHGWRPGQGYPDFESQERTQALLQANGNYQADASPRSRKKAIEKWRRWLEAQEK